MVKIIKLNTIIQMLFFASTLRRFHIKNWKTITGHKLLLVYEQACDCEQIEDACITSFLLHAAFLSASRSYSDQQSV